MAEEGERRTVNLVRLRQYEHEHYLLLPAKVGDHKAKFIIETGSDRSIISKALVQSSQITPCERKEYRYATHSFKIVGEADLPITLDYGHSPFTVTQKFLVADSKKTHIMIDSLAIDFLVDFQCDIDVDTRLNLTLSRTPLEP